MRLRILSLFLILSLLCGCAQQQPTPSETARSAGELAEDIIIHCQLGDTEQLSEEDCALWLSAFYQLPEDSWDDCAVYRSANSMSALEIAVIHLTGDTQAETVVDCLERYKLDRQGDFTGYDPAQAAIVEQGRIVLSDGEDYVALLICEPAEEAGETFLAVMRHQLSVSRPPVHPSAAPSFSVAPEPTATPTPTPVPTPELTPPPIDHLMDIYDTSAILSAWSSGDETALSDYEKVILTRCREILGEIIKEGMNDYEKERAIYQWIVRNVEYDYAHYDQLGGASLDSSTPYNPLVKGKGVCMGFASTFQLLADLSGLESIIVPGRAFHNREDHAWNMIRLNGEWYCLDATWDIGKSKVIFWDYFNVTSDYMTQTNHQWDYESVPTATATDGGNP